MKGRIRRCSRDLTYTLSDTCPVCGQATGSPHPARFSPCDRFSSYRVKIRGEYDPRWSEVLEE